MPRPAKAIRPVEKSISLPQTLCAKVDLVLWSDLEERVPHGAWAKYVEKLIQQDLERIAESQKTQRVMMGGV